MEPSSIEPSIGGSITHDSIKKIYMGGPFYATRSRRDPLLSPEEGCLTAQPAEKLRNDAGLNTHT